MIDMLPMRILYCSQKIAAWAWARGNEKGTHRILRSTSQFFQTQKSVLWYGKTKLIWHNQENVLVPTIWFALEEKWNLWKGLAYRGNGGRTLQHFIVFAYTTTWEQALQHFEDLWGWFWIRIDMQRIVQTTEPFRREHCQGKWEKIANSFLQL